MCQNKAKVLVVALVDLKKKKRNSRKKLLCKDLVREVVVKAMTNYRSEVVAQ